MNEIAPRPAVLIDASNLRGGGGLQVASSFIDELTLLRESVEVRERYPWLTDELVVEASAPVVENMLCDPSSLGVVTVNNYGPRSARLVSDDKVFGAVFSVFGPSYVPRRSASRLAGFADVTSLWPKVLGGERASVGTKSRLALRRQFSRAYFRTRDHVIVEADHVKAALVAQWHVDPESISVVPNTLNRAFDNISPSGQADLRLSDAGLRVCYVTRAYPHKNLDLLGRVGDILDGLGMKVTFVLTLTSNEWSELSPATKLHSINVGPLTSAALPGLYQKCHASIFPSLSECFSVTPLEALATGTPLIASDRPFVRDICGDTARYFEPTDPKAAADQLRDVFRNEEKTIQLVQDGQDLAQHWLGPRERAEAYLGVIDSVLRARSRETSR